MPGCAQRVSAGVDRVDGDTLTGDEIDAAPDEALPLAPARRRRTWFVAVAAAAVVALIAGLTFALRGGPRPGHPNAAGTRVPGPASTLQGDWTLAKVFGATGAPQAATATATLDIAANGTVTGTDGCRTFTGTVSTSGATATFSLTMPEPACSPIVEQTAGLVDRVLSGPVTFTLAAGALVLSKSEIGRLSFTGNIVGGQDPQLLTAHDWQIATITYGTGRFRNGAPSQDNGLLIFKANSYEVQHTCSGVDGTVQYARGSMTLSRQISGGHSCPAPINQPYRGQSAEAIDAILTGQVRWSIDGSVLTLTSGQGSLRAIGGIPSELTGPTWRLTGTAQGATATTAVGSVVLTFPAGKRVQLVRCYTSSGGLYLGDSSFSVANFRTTVALPCPSGPPGTQQQNDFLDRLFSGGEVTWAVVGDTLTLSRDGVGQAIFTRKH